MLSVRDVLQLSAFQGAKVLAGANHLDNNITSATVLEATSEEVTTWIKGGELFLTSLYAIAQDVQKQLQILKTLSNKNCSGVVIFSLGYFMKEIAPSIVNLAECLGVPLIVMPPESSYDKALEQITASLLNIQSAELEMALQIQREIYALIIRRKSEKELFVFLENALKKTLAFYDSDGLLVYPSTEQSGLPMEMTKLFPNRRPEALNNLQDAGFSYVDHVMFFSVATMGSYYGTIVLFNIDVTEQRKMHLILSNVILAMTPGVNKKRSLTTKNLQKKQEFFDKMLGQKFESVYDVYTGAESLGLNLRNKHYLMVVDCPQENKEMYFEEIKKYALSDNVDHEILMLNNEIILLLFSEAQEGSVKRWKKLCSQIEKTGIHSAKPFIGLSNYFDKITDVRLAYHQAWNTIQLGRSFFGDQAYLLYSDLGVYALLFETHDLNKMGEYVKENVERLEKYDREHNAEYMKTLRVLLMNGDNVDAIAQKLHVHKNTLFYRKKRIVEIVGHDPLIMPHSLNYLSYFILRSIVKMQQP